jgi:hypothetical protein
MKTIKKILKSPEFFVLISGGFIFTTPFLLTRSLVSPEYSFADTGQIGDTIGGLTAPFIGLLSAYLVYKSFLAQIQANKIIVQARNEDMIIANINNWIDRLEASYNNFNTGGNKSGTAWIKEITTEIIRGIQTVDRNMQEKIENPLERSYYVGDHIYLRVGGLLRETLSILNYIVSKNLDFRTYEFQFIQLKEIYDKHFNELARCRVTLKMAFDYKASKEVPFSYLLLIDDIDRCFLILFAKRSDQTLAP